MGTCPIPTSEGNKKTKAQTIIQKYDPVSRRIYDIRVDCVYPHISPITVTVPINGIWNLHWTETNATTRKVYGTGAGTNFNITNLSENGCTITSTSASVSGTATFTVTVSSLGGSASSACSFYVYSQPTISTITVDQPINGVWNLHWSETDTTGRVVNYTSGVSNLIISDVTSTGCTIRNPTSQTQNGNAVFTVTVSGPGGIATNTCTFTVYRTPTITDIHLESYASAAGSYSPIPINVLWTEGGDVTSRTIQLLGSNGTEHINLYSITYGPGTSTITLSDDPPLTDTLIMIVTLTGGGGSANASILVVDTT